MRTKVLALEKKNAADCTLILNQCKEFDHVTSALSLAKVQVKKLLGKLKTAHTLFKKTLTVKSDYEKIILKLHTNPATNILTQQIINDVAKCSDRGTKNSAV